MNWKNIKRKTLEGILLAGGILTCFGVGSCVDKNIKELRKELTELRKEYPNTKLVFTKGILSDRQIFMIDGTEMRNLSNNYCEDSQPCLSKDGKKIAFTRKRRLNKEIYIMNSDGTNPQKLTNDPEIDEHPTFSPDGNEIAFVSTRDRSMYKIYIMNSDGTNQRALTNELSGQWPVWSPNSNKIVLDSVDRIYSINSDGTNPQNLTNDPSDNNFPLFSPDGKKIAFTSDRDGNKEIYIMNSDGTNPQNLTNDPSNDYSISFSPDGKKILFKSDRDGADRNYIMNSDGTNPTRFLGGLINFSDSSHPPRISWISTNQP